MYSKKYNLKEVKLKNMYYIENYIKFKFRISKEYRYDILVYKIW